MDKKIIIIIALIIIVFVVGGILALKIFTIKSVENGSDYAAEKATENINNMEIEHEKENIKLAAMSAMVTEDEIIDLSYEKFDLALKDVFKDIKYTLKGPDSSGIFNLKINNRTYRIDNKGNIL